MYDNKTKTNIIDFNRDKKDKKLDQKLTFLNLGLFLNSKKYRFLTLNISYYG